MNPEQFEAADKLVRSGIAAVQSGVAAVQQRPAPGRILRKPVEYTEVETLMGDDSIQMPVMSIEGLIPRGGLILLGGRPKEGKSWLGCQLALSFVTGQAFCGWMKVLNGGQVHLWALEDQLPITKDKMGKLLGAFPPPHGIKVFPELPLPILGGGADIIRGCLKEHPAQLVILDSLFKLGAHAKFADINQQDYDIIDACRKIGTDCGCAVVIVMHTKKGSPGGNPIENLLGTTGLPAAADAVAELKRYPENTGKLTVVGRTVMSDDYELHWHGGPDEWGWSIAGQGEAVAVGHTSETVLQYLEAQGASPVNTISRELNKEWDAVMGCLRRLESAGKVQRDRNTKKWSLTRSP